MKIGLKNSLDIVDDVASIVDFAVNEQCAQLGECQKYNSFLALNKPVFHIEYPVPLNAQAATGITCVGPSVEDKSTVLKDLTLNGITYYCDGSYVNTATVGGISGPRPSQSPKPPQPSRPSSMPSVSSQRSSTTMRPIPTRSRTSSSQRPTSTPGGGSGGGGGCKSKHWDQCGGNDWKGCTVCEVCMHALNGEIATNGMYSRRTRARVCRRRTTISACKVARALVAQSLQ
jgi:hypothetical protein